jgi:predicted ATPase
MPSNALDYITIKGFKSIESIGRLALKPINILIGANGSGKSNFLDAFRLLQSIGEGRLRHYVGIAGGAEKILHFGSRTTAQLEIELGFSQGNIQYEVGLSPTAEDGLFLDPIETTLSSADRSGPTPWIHAQLASWRVYHLHDTSRMRITANVDDNRFLRSDGSNLPALLYYLREMHRDSYHLIRATVQSVAPFFDDFILQPVEVNPDTIKLEWKHKISGQYFGASSLSDGTLRFIALAVLFLQPVSRRPPIILLDEPELGLHPYAIVLLASMIRQASVDIQVIVSTQSPLLLDNFDPQEVLVASRVDGGTKLTRLDPEPLATWLEDYSLGQLWEKNEFGGAPVRD